MCWNATISLNTYFLGVFASLLALSNQVITFPVFLFYQSWITMQLFEALVWKKTFSNELVSKWMFALILLQPLASLYSMKEHKELKKKLMIGYLLFLSVTFTMIRPISTIDFRSEKSESNGHLAWHWLDFPIIAFVVWMGFLMARFVIEKDYIVISLAMISALVTYLLYHKTKTWGSLWCWLINVTSFYLLYLIFKKSMC